MRKVSIGRSLAVMAALASLGMNMPALRSSPPMLPNIQRPEPKRKKHKRGPLPLGKSEQKFDRARLICDRSSSVRKMTRWHRANPGEIYTPDEKALMRHPWYRKKLAWDALRKMMNAA